MSQAMDGVHRVTFFGYPDCLRLENGQAAATLGHHVGGRILEYSWEGQNILYLDPEQAGWVPPAPRPAIGPCAGRFDIGPEHVVPRRPALWEGPWATEATGDRSARLTSPPDAGTGVQLTRDFTLAAVGPYLTCAQTIRNVSDGETQWCHWSRTFARGGGVAIVPLTPGSRFPRGYVQYGPGPAINFRPDDPAIRRRGDFIEVHPTPQHAKLGFDSAAGWMAYLAPDGLLFVKRYPVYPDRVYNEIAGLTLSVWYPPAANRIELEPIGPRERLAPGEAATFAEEWALLPWPVAAPEESIDLQAIADTVAQLP